MKIKKFEFLKIFLLLARTCCKNLTLKKKIEKCSPLSFTKILLYMSKSPIVLGPKTAMNFPNRKPLLWLLLGGGGGVLSGDLSCRQSQDVIGKLCTRAKCLRSVFCFWVCHLLKHEFCQWNNLSSELLNYNV
jgi:hypothetical protein